MRGFQLAKKVAVSLNKHLTIKRFVIVYLLIVIAFHLTAPTTAHYTYEEKMTGEMFVSDQLEEETDEPDNVQASDQVEEVEIDTESELDHNEDKSNEKENQKDDTEDTGKSDVEVDQDAATQSEEAEPVDQQINNLEDAAVSGKEEEGEQAQ
ncbi:hypothetical protein [Bacillus norwichensis]|uniref:YqxM protein n=1 Tax=Bacillus norwichensis TaxID=2762217 RepID=A0ABR8VHI7_9BACI|nr:hypothetical protein [Bacillus norwichensis]MBD8004147.1 hypothetical protein [Bacillus norwichensis]